MSMVNHYAAELDLAKQLALSANDIAMSHIKTQLNFKTKADNSPVTVADEAINRMVIERIRDKFPADGILGEEESWRAARSRLWVCDPIDGTTSFSIGLPTFMFSIALVENGVPKVCVASNPTSGEIFWAVKDKGAFKNGDPLHVGIRPLKDAWMLYPANPQSLYKNHDFYQALQQRTYQTTIVHGSVYKGTLVAQGLADAMIHLESGHPWDFAAVDLLIREAGGCMTDATGAPLRLNTDLKSVIASNQRIHGKILDLVSEIM